MAAPTNELPRTGPGCLSYGVFAAALLWVSALIGLSAPVAWLARDVLDSLSDQWPFWLDIAIAVGQAALVALPIGLLAVFAQAPALRGSYLALLEACGWMLAFSLARMLSAGWFQLAALATIAVGGIALLTLRRGRPGAPPTPSMAWLRACIVAPLVALPWLVFGALGSPLDTLLALLAGAAIGVVAARILDRRLLPGLLRADASTGVALVVGGSALGGVLLILAAGAGFQAANLLLLAALPPLGFGALALAWPFAQSHRAWLAPAVLVGAAAAAGLALFDPDEITLVLGGADIPGQVVRAAPAAFLVACVVSGLLLLARRLHARLPTTGALLGACAATALVAGGVYAVAGRPGFAGEQLFVILRDQAALPAALPGEPRAQRIARVYATLSSHATTTQADLRADLDQFGVAYTPYYLVNAIEVDGGPLVRRWLESRPEVDRVLESPRLRPLPVPPPPEPGDQPAPGDPPWNITAIGADRVWDELGVTGDGIVIGQSDSGVDGGHPALAPGYRGADGTDAYNWFDPWYGSSAPRDYGSHGTHTLGSALGRDGIGVAPGATWYGCVNLARNLANPARYLDCMQFMLAPHPRGGDPLRDGDPTRAAHVINNSWGCPPIEGCDPRALEPAVDALRAAGIFVVASAGNEGPACSSVAAPPAIYDAAFSVGAIDQSGDVSAFSSRGPVAVDGSGRIKPDIVAPGAEILSSQPGNTYGWADGTSMAGPHVAGVVALMWSANPALIGDIAGTERLLRASASPYDGSSSVGCAGSEPGDNAVGAGVLNAFAAVQAARAAR